MRISLDLPDETFRRLEIQAAERGVSLKQILRTAVERELRLHRVQLPLVESKRPGTLTLTNAEIEDFLA